MTSDIAVIILTKDEELHLERCILSARKVATDVWVVDSFSTDQTCQIAKSLGAHVVQHVFSNQAEQFNWAIDNLPITQKWIWRLDADEVIEDSLAGLAQKQLSSLPDSVTGIYVNKKIIFMGRPLLHGGWYPAPQIKVFRRGFGRCEDKVMDEHIYVMSGVTVYWDGDQTDWNLHDIDWWWRKHEAYAKREARNLLQMESGQEQLIGVKPRFSGTGAERRRWAKLLYSHCPLFVRPVILFFCRYVLMGGFLDGYAGWYWHTRQGLCYRLLVDKELWKLKHKD